jgi:Na+/H+-dicarboxylate symporter
MCALGRATSIAWKTIGLYVMTTVLASLMGVFSTLIWYGMFTQESIPPSGPALITLGCNEEGMFMTEMDDGSIVCAANSLNPEDQEFEIIDISKTFQTASSGPVTLNLSETIYQGIFYKIIPDNIVGSFESGNFAAIIFFALVFGFALGKAIRNKKENTLLNVIQEINDVFVIFINWIIMCTPFAVWSLIASTLGKQEDAKQQFKNVGFLVAAILTGQAAHIVVLWFVIFYGYTRWNPFTYLKQIVPAQTMAFACSSSAATIPVTLQSVRNTGKVPEAILRFIVPLGATINMDGTAIGYPITCIWLAKFNGIQPTVASYVLLIIISTVGSIGSAPIPSAGLVLVITAYNTVFNTTGVPNGFGYVVAIDWFLDRFETAMNVTGDAIVSGMVAKNTNLEDIEEEENENEFSFAEEKGVDLAGVEEAKDIESIAIAEKATNAQ